MEKEITKMIYGMEMKNLGVKEAFEENIKMVKEITTNKEFKKEFKKEYGKNTEYQNLLMESDTKLSFIGWTLLFKETSQVKEALPMLVAELRKIADELEGAK